MSDRNEETGDRKQETRKSDEGQSNSSLSIAWEQSSFATNCPIAVEVTFTAPSIDETAEPRLPLSFLIRASL